MGFELNLFSVNNDPKSSIPDIKQYTHSSIFETVIPSKNLIVKLKNLSNLQTIKRNIAPQLALKSSAVVEASNIRKGRKQSNLGNSNDESECVYLQLNQFTRKSSNTLTHSKFIAVSHSKLNSALEYLETIDSRPQLYTNKRAALFNRQEDWNPSCKTNNPSNQYPRRSTMITSGLLGQQQIRKDSKVTNSAMNRSTLKLSNADVSEDSQNYQNSERFLVQKQNINNNNKLNINESSLIIQPNDSLFPISSPPLLSLNHNKDNLNSIDELPNHQNNSESQNFSNIYDDNEESIQASPLPAPPLHNHLLQPSAPSSPKTFIQLDDQHYIGQLLSEQDPNISSHPTTPTANAKHNRNRLSLPQFEHYHNYSQNSTKSYSSFTNHRNIQAPQLCLNGKSVNCNEGGTSQAILTNRKSSILDSAGRSPQVRDSQVSPNKRSNISSSLMPTSRESFSDDKQKQEKQLLLQQQQNLLQSNHRFSLANRNNTKQQSPVLLPSQQCNNINSSNLSLALHSPRQLSSGKSTVVSTSNTKRFTSPQKVSRVLFQQNEKQSNSILQQQLQFQYNQLSNPQEQPAQQKQTSKLSDFVDTLLTMKVKEHDQMPKTLTKYLHPNRSTADFNKFNENQTDQIQNILNQDIGKVKSDSYSQQGITEYMLERNCTDEIARLKTFYRFGFNASNKDDKMVKLQNAVKLVIPDSEKGSLTCNELWTDKHLKVVTEKANFQKQKQIVNDFLVFQARHPNGIRRHSEDIFKEKQEGRHSKILDEHDEIIEKDNSQFKIPQHTSQTNHKDLNPRSKSTQQFSIKRNYKNISTVSQRKFYNDEQVKDKQMFRELIGYSKQVIQKNNKDIKEVDKQIEECEQAFQQGEDSQTDIKKDIEFLQQQ